MQLLKPSKQTNEITLYESNQLVRTVDTVELYPQPIQTDLKVDTLDEWLDSLCPTPEELAEIITTPDPPTFLDKMWSAIQAKQ